jgi:hypothetical protein
MTTTQIKTKIARAIEIEAITATLDDELKGIKADLKAEAESREPEHVPTEGDGWSWRHEDNSGHVAIVTRPGRKLKAKIDPEAKGFDKIKAAAGRAWSLLFAQVPTYKPLDGFRDLAVAHLGRDAQKLIKLVSSEAPMQVTFTTLKPEDT